jgi:hypothetical protein
MNTCFRNLILLLASTIGANWAAGQGTAFTYQGQLIEMGAPANGQYDFSSGLYSSSSGGTLVSALYTNTGVGVTNGLFTMIVDFGDVFNGSNLWLQINVGTNGATNFIALSPRQELTPVPYAIFAEGADAAGLTGPIPTSSLSGTYGGVLNLTNGGNSFAGNGAGLTNVNAVTLDGVSAATFWRTNGNAGANPTNGAFLGTTDNNPLEIHVEGRRGWRLEPTLNDANHSNIVNVVGGASVNFAAAGVHGATIAGGGADYYLGFTEITNSVTADFGTVGGGEANSSGGTYATVGGGWNNRASGPGAFVGGGGYDGQYYDGNIASGGAAVIGGGTFNLSTALDTVVAGGKGNAATGNFATVAGGNINGAYGSNSAVCGGAFNDASAASATVGGGYYNVASGIGSFIGGGGFDGNSPDGLGNEATGAVSVVGGGLGNSNASYAGVIGGGLDNDANSTTGGYFSGGATVAGGFGNKASTDQTTIGGGYLNKASALFATVPGGLLNTAGGTGSFAAGQDAQTTNNGTFIWGDGSQLFNGANMDNAFNVLASGGMFFYDGSNGVSLDNFDQNNGSIYYGLRFGRGSGEGIASQRTSSGNVHGLDFYTGFNNRMCISNNGFVGINTTSPSERLEVNGNFVLIDGANADDGNGSIDAYIGGDGSGSDVKIGSMNSSITSVGFWNQSAGAWMHIACSAITINGGSDLAEPFKISPGGEELAEGAVVVIDEQNPGRLKRSSQPYDTRVAGVLSGANGIHPGIQMQQEGTLEGGKNVALSGRVYVQADASNGPIKPGDLLTTSGAPGRAMKVTDHVRAQGAILGKAMSGLSEGNGMVLVLVTLQ